MARAPPGTQSNRSTRQNRLALTLLVCFGCVLRLVGIQGPCALAFAPTLSSVLEIDRHFTQGTFWRAWSDTFYSIQGLSLVERSAVMLPVAAAFQRLLGPSFALVPIIGCFCGASAIALAWLVGRQFTDRVTALCFAALVATSPLQISWSRVGGLYISAVPHLLLGMWFSYAAGATGGLWLGVLAGITSWLSLYNNYQTRVLLVLVPAMVTSAARRHGRTPLRMLVLLVAVGLPQVSAFFALRNSGVVHTFWPQFGAFATNPDAVTDVGSLVAESVRHLQLHTVQVLRVIFYAGRVDPYSQWANSYQWDIAYGGIYPVITLFLGIIGLAVALRHYRDHLPWFLLLALGFIVPAASGAEPRRLLMFDVAWNFVAARGLAAVLRTTRIASMRPRFQAICVATLFFVLGVWSVVAFCRVAMLSDEEFRGVPFGAGTNGDGMFCSPCYSMAREWQQRVAEDDTVVLVNGNLGLDGALTPGSLDDFERLAALSSGKPDGVVDFYAVLESERRLAGDPSDPVAFLRAVIRQTNPRRVVWYFKSPTAWEEQLVTSLGRLGATVEEIPYPYSARNVVGGIYFPYLKRLNKRAVATPETTDALLATLERPLLSDPSSEHAGRRLGLVDVRSLPDVAIGLARDRRSTTGGANGSELPRWTALVPTGYVPDLFPAADTAVRTFGGIRAVVERGADAPEGPTFVALTELGESAVLGPDGSMESRERQPELMPVGRGCAAYARDGWWVVNPLTGTVNSRQPTEWIPSKPWIGVSATAGDELLLASADGRFYVLDPEHRAIVGDFTAPVWPSRRSGVGDCSVIGAGDDWSFSYDFTSAHLSVVDSIGTVEDFNLKAVLEDAGFVASARAISAVAADRGYLGVAIEAGNTSRILTLRLPR